jgi:biopolymer transport protein ExbB
LEAGDLEQAKNLSDNARDPILSTINSGLQHQHMSVRGALDMAIESEMDGAGRSLIVLDTAITLAPLLGLLGTVTGIMKSFVSIGSEQLAVEKVTGGIGEALIATAAGLGIAIISLLALNYFNRKAEKFASQLERAATNLEMMVLHHGEKKQ